MEFDEILHLQIDETALVVSTQAEVPAITEHWLAESGSVTDLACRPTIYIYSIKHREDNMTPDDRLGVVPADDLVGPLPPSSPLKAIWS